MKKEKLLDSINPMFLKGIAHRGLFNSNDIENGKQAFINAITNNIAMEFDVHLTKDNNLVVIHDTSLKRVTNKDGIVEELTLKEIKENYKLLNGEEIMTFDELLKLVDERVGIVVELKSYKRNSLMLAKRVNESLKVIKNKKNVILISFYPLALMYFKNKGYVRQLLISKKNSYMQIFKYFFEGIDVEYELLNKGYVKRFAKNHLINVYTIDTLDMLNKTMNKCDMITFQNLPISYFKK